MRGGSAACWRRWASSVCAAGRAPGGPAVPQAHQVEESAVNLEIVHEIEIAKWDGLAAAMRSDENLRVRDADFRAYARRVVTMTGIADFLGDLRDREVLELGCGMGEITTLLARSRARVTAIDISPRSVSVARRRAQLHGVACRIRLVSTAAERLPFEDESFDIVVGKAVLHHLDVTRAAPELHRVLRDGGRAAFSEPLGTNPMLTFARDHLLYPHKHPRGADVPLSYEAVRAWEAPFFAAWHREVQLLSMAERALGCHPMPRLRRADEWLLARVPVLGRFCRYVVLSMVK
jgi:ubiquinone/menaquinone biosynthesis C-methylase UbiE